VRSPYGEVPDAVSRMTGYPTSQKTQAAMRAQILMRAAPDQSFYAPGEERGRHSPERSEEKTVSVPKDASVFFCRLQLFSFPGVRKETLSHI